MNVNIIILEVALWSAFARCYFARLCIVQCTVTNGTFASSVFDDPKAGFDYRFLIHFIIKLFPPDSFRLKLLKILLLHFILILSQSRSDKASMDIS